MPEVTRDGVKLDYEVVGTGPPLILINGMGRDRTAWIFQKHPLSERFTLVLFDNRGCGKSDRPPEGYDIPTLTGDLKAVIEAAGFERIALMGISMGGMIAQYFAVTYPEMVSSLVFIATAAGKPGLKNLTPAFEEYVKSMPSMSPEERVMAGMKLILTPKYLEENRETIEALLPTTIENSASPEVYNMLLPAIKGFSVFDKLPTIKVPTLVIAGEKDEIVDPENTRALASAIPGAEEIIYPDIGHGPILERWEELNSEVLRFFADIKGE